MKPRKSSSVELRPPTSPISPPTETVNALWFERTDVGGKFGGQAGVQRLLFDNRWLRKIDKREASISIL